MDWPTEWDIEGELTVAWAVDERISWFAYEEAIYDWLDIATLAPDTWAPSLKARLVGYASIYKKKTS